METNNKLREALTRVKKIAASYINCHDDEIDRVMTEIVATCDSALAAPPRNCDVGTAEEQAKRFKFSKCDEPPKCRPWDECCLTCFAKWAQMPYEEGGNK